MLSTVNFDEAEYAQALKCSRGVYQLGLLRGIYEWTGSDLKGKALTWSWQYELSRRSLLTRLRTNNVKFAFFTLPWFVLKPVLCIGMSNSINPTDNTRKYFMKALKHSPVEEALKATLAHEVMFNGASSYVATQDMNFKTMQQRGKHYHLDWAGIKNAKYSDNRKPSILPRNRSSGAKIAL